jgi:hypothetical protein
MAEGLFVAIQASDLFPDIAESNSADTYPMNEAIRCKARQRKPKLIGLYTSAKKYLTFLMVAKHRLCCFQYPVHEEDRGLMELSVSGTLTDSPARFHIATKVADWVCRRCIWAKQPHE